MTQSFMNNYREYFLPAETYTKLMRLITMKQREMFFLENTWLEFSKAISKKNKAKTTQSNGKICNKSNLNLKFSMKKQ